jgi:hypothetical protein
LGQVDPPVVDVHTDNIPNERDRPGKRARGGPEVTLSAPVARGQVATERGAALLINMTAVAAALALVAVGGIVFARRDLA